MRKQSSGFTLIELIVVIVILGILAATALPKFVDVGSDARRAALTGVEGAMRAANSLIYSKSSIAGIQSIATSSVTINGTAVNTAYGYASTVSPDLAAVMDLSSSYTTAASTITVQTNCLVTYAKATSTTTPTYTQTTTGC